MITIQSTLLPSTPTANEPSSSPQESPVRSFAQSSNESGPENVRVQRRYLEGTFFDDLGTWKDKKGYKNPID